ncbi:matrilin-2-like [Poecilia reticulata]|uniref:matrilin-2-like n=1 Tax=Poecilia reticulata TaxID=8081 RepID=UPI0007EA78D4|nr:PREDICTED: matrilin-2-like [Poecilia reticulata]
MRSLVLAFFCLLCCSAARPERRRPKLVMVKRRNDTTIQNNTPENPCKATPLDFIFVIDSSRSIRPEDYDKVKTFIINLLQFLDVGLNATRVGLLQYGSVVQPEFSLSTHTSKAQVEEAVRNMQHLATGTMTGLAIQYTMEVALTEEQGARPKSLQIPRIAMIVTDGRPQDTVEEIAAEAREAGIQIFAIGVGRVEMKTLKAIGSQPHSEHVHLVANFSQIETLISVFKSKLCGGSDMCKVVEHQCQHICVSSPASYRCRCRKGFTLNPDGKTCKAEDMCAMVDHGCDHICVNLADGYECRCRPGYELTIDLKTCNRIDYCDLGNHGCEHNCVSLPGSYICSCKKGFVLNADGKTCSQIDHCAAGSHGCEQEFMNTETACVCKCTNGYTLRSDGKTCQKVDPCADGSHGCEQEFVSAGDSCVCRCRIGFTLRPDGKTCKKVDPCADGSHGCEQEFVSAGDSCVCRCRKGFTLRPDGKTCKKIEHCLQGNHGCEQEFMNTENSCVCKCGEGYTLRQDGKTCQTRYIHGVAVHWYLDSLVPAEASLGATHQLFPEYYLFGTEACAGWSSVDRGVKLGSWDHAEQYAHDILEDLNHYVVGWTDWNLALDQTGGPNWVKNFVDSPVIVDAKRDVFYKQPTFYSMAHFSAFLWEGSQRVGVSASAKTQLEFSAFVRPDGSVVLIVLNRSSSAIQFEVWDPAVGYIPCTAPAHSLLTAAWNAH